MSEGAEAQRRRLRKRLLGLLVGILISVAAVWLALRNVDIEDVLAGLSRADLRFIPVMVAFKVAAMLLRSARWKVELSAMRDGPFAHTFRAVSLGDFCNTLMPFKLGELVRVALLRRHNPTLHAGDSLATIAAERVLDGAVVGLMVLAVLGSLSTAPWVLQGTLALVVVTSLVVITAIAEPLHSFLIRVLPERHVFAVARHVIAALSRGSAVMRSPRALVLALLCTIGIWLCESGMYVLAARAIGVNLSYAACIVITFLLTFGLLVPSAPGQVGTHQALSVVVMTPFGVDRALAISTSVFLQAVALTVLAALGVFVLLRESASRELLGHAAR